MVGKVRDLDLFTWTHGGRTLKNGARPHFVHGLRRTATAHAQTTCDAHRKCNKDKDKDVDLAS